MTENENNRWRARPWLANSLKMVVYVAPFILSALTIRATQSLLIARIPELGWWPTVLCSFVAAAGVLIVAGRCTRRLLPLALLLKLSLVFPDQVPSRFGVALRAASPRRLARQVESESAEQANVAERVLTLVSALSSHDRRTRGHSERVRALTVLIADQMGIKGEDRDKLEWAALLHDLGKLDVPPEILNKKGRPSEKEWSVLREHPAGGPGYAAGLADWMGSWIHAMDQHHERYDGTGYPKGLTAEDITMSGRIVAVSDAFEVMTATRSYKKPMSHKAARAELVACAGSHFDPAVVRSFMQVTLGDLHKALGPMSWLGSLPLVGPAVQSLGSIGGGVVLGGSAYPAIAAAAALTLFAPIADPATDEPGVLAAANGSTVEDGGAADLGVVDDGVDPGADAADGVGGIDVDRVLDPDDVDDVDDTANGTVDDTVDDAVDDSIDTVVDVVQQQTAGLTGGITDALPDLVTDQLTEVVDVEGTVEQANLLIDTLVEIPEVPSVPEVPLQSSLSELVSEPLAPQMPEVPSVPEITEVPAVQAITEGIEPPEPAPVEPPENPTAEAVEDPPADPLEDLLNLGG